MAAAMIQPQDAPLQVILQIGKVDTSDERQHGGAGEHEQRKLQSVPQVTRDMPDELGHRGARRLRRVLA